jgi:hypothetical protein
MVPPVSDNEVAPDRSQLRRLREAKTRRGTGKREDQAENACSVDAMTQVDEEVNRRALRQPGSPGGRRLQNQLARDTNRNEEQMTESNYPVDSTGIELADVDIIDGLFNRLAAIEAAEGVEE